VPESFTCDECGKSFPTEGDMRQHTDSMHGAATIGSYKEKEGTVKDDEPKMPPTTPRSI
jgi:hypothetical protein